MTTTETRIETVSPHERFTPETIAKLDAPLNEGRVAYDPRGNPYLEGWDVIAAANVYFGFDGWSSSVQSVECSTRSMVTRTDRKTGAQYEVEIAVYSARVSVSAGGVTHTDVGTGVTADDRPEAHETAIKGAATDALKRALRQFGNQFGNGLYDKGRTGGGYVETPAEPIADWWDTVTDAIKAAGLDRIQVSKALNCPATANDTKDAAREWLNTNTTGSITGDVKALVTFLGGPQPFV